MYKLNLFVINNNSYKNIDYENFCYYNNIDYNKNIDYEKFCYYYNIFSSADSFILYINKLLMDKMNYLKKIKKNRVIEYTKIIDSPSKMLIIPPYISHNKYNPIYFNIKKNNMIKNNIIKNNTINFLKLKILLSVQYFY